MKQSPYEIKDVEILVPQFLTKSDLLKNCSNPELKCSFWICFIVQWMVKAKKREITCVINISTC